MLMGLQVEMTNVESELRREIRVWGWCASQKFTEGDRSVQGGRGLWGTVHNKKAQGLLHRAWEITWEK